MKKYTVLLERDHIDGTYTVTVPALPGLVTQGKDIEDAIRMAKDAIRCHIHGLLKEGQDPPDEIYTPALIPVEIDEAA